MRNAGSIIRLGLTASLVVCFAAALPACKKKEEPKETPVVAAPPPPPPKPAPPPKPDVAFKGTYTRYATSAFKNGRRISVPNSKGTGTMTIGQGRATFVQTYEFRGKNKRVTQYYTYTDADVKPVAGGGYDVALVYEKMDSDDNSYAPDKNKPKLEARKQADGWQIGFLASDNNGVMGGVEFK